MTTSFSPPNVNGVPVPYFASFEDLRTDLASAGPQAWAAFVALGHVPTRNALELLIELANSDDWRYRRAAIEALTFHPFGREAADVVQAGLHDASAFVVQTACQVSGRLQLEQCHAELVELLGAKAAATRIAALEELWQPADPERVLSMATHDASEDVRRTWAGPSEQTRLPAIGGSCTRRGKATLCHVIEYGHANWLRSTAMVEKPN